MKKSMLLVLPVSIICLFGCRNKDSKLPTIYSQEFRNVTYVDQNGNKSSFITTHFNNSPIGYMSLGKVLNNILEQNKIAIETKYQGHSFILHNKLTDVKCTIDFDQQTITYDNYDKYNVVEESYVPFIDSLIMGGKQYFPSIDKTKQKYLEPEKGTKRVIDLSRYKIPLYFDQSFGYVPIDIFKTFITPFLTLDLYYNGTHLYSKDILKEASEKERKEYFQEGNIFNSEYMEYTYNLLALELDFSFGLDQRECRTKKETKKYLESEAYKIIEPYHDKLVSLSPGVSDSAYIDIFAKYFDDGGHTMYGEHNCLAYENVSEFHYGDESMYTSEVHKKLKTEREKAKLSPSQIVGKECSHSFEIGKNENKDIAIITFDSFDVSKNQFGEKDITSDNYYQNTLYTVTYANNQLRNTQEGKNVKNLIIDLSLNTGGDSVAEHYIASWLCNGVTTKVRNTKDKTYQEMTVSADVNRDGKIDDNDYLPSHVENVYCMVSATSFSCGNLLPFHLKELRTAKGKNVKIMGDRSGGGSCLVSTIPTGLGVNYQVSSNYQLGTYDSTSYNDFKSNESGISADFYKIESPYDKNISSFYNRNAIFTAIHDSHK